MKCVSLEVRYIRSKSESASVSVETAILLPFIFLLFFLFFSFFQYIAAYLNIYQAADITAKYMSYYSCIYYREGLDRVNNKVVSKLFSELGGDGIEFSEILKNLGNNAVCSQIAETVMCLQLDKNADNFVNKLYKTENISCMGSSFFEAGNEFDLHVSCNVDTFFPLPEFIGEGYYISLNIKGNGWMEGEYFAKKIENSIWKLSNFERGRAVEERLGCNLPEDYPIIDIYDRKTGTVTLVRSINHTAKTYLNTEYLKRELDDALKKVKNFNGSPCSISEDGTQYITAENIKKRKIVLVIPTNDMTKMQMKAVLEFSARCALDNVELVLDRYHAA